MTGLASGNLRHRVELQERIDTQDPITGNPETTWDTVARPWAQIVPMSGRELVAAASEQSEVRGRIVLRYRGEIDAKMRIVYRGLYYNILAVLPDPVSGIEYVTCMTGEGVRLDQ